MYTQWTSSSTPRNKTPYKCGHTCSKRPIQEYSWQQKIRNNPNNHLHSNRQIVLCSYNRRRLSSENEWNTTMHIFMDKYHGFSKYQTTNLWPYNDIIWGVISNCSSNVNIFEYCIYSHREKLQLYLQHSFYKNRFTWLCGRDVLLAFVTMTSSSPFI